MSVDLGKNSSAMKEACKEVVNDKTETDWALFGYEGQTNVLKLESTGDGGLDELIEDFNPGKIQYAFLKVEDPKTSLPKFVLINWQGETAPGNRRGICAMHLHDVEKFMSGHHVTISVRNEDELDLDIILEKVSKVSASAYNFRVKPQGMEHSPAPVGTAHKKINPMAELPDMNTREKFWQQDQEAEKGRILAERERRESEQKISEQKRIAREEQERQQRDEAIKEKERKISVLREQEASTQGAGDLDRQRWEEQRRLDAEDEEERRNRSQVMSMNRNKEAQELLAGRGSQAKKVFQRNSSQGQMNFVPQFKKSNEPKPSVVSKTFTPEPASQVFTNKQEISQNSVKEASEINPTKPNQIEKEETVTNDIAPPPPAFDSSPVQNQASEEVHHASPAKIEKEDGINDGSEKNEGVMESPTMDSYGTCAVALYDYQAADETEISFDPGQIISHIDQIDPGWWQGLGPDGNYGLFPANYVEIIDNKELQVM